MKSTIFVSFLALTLLSSTVMSSKSKDCVEPPECGPNAVYQSCGTACPPTCKVPNPEVCTMQCVPGCQCIDGYLKNDQGDCVQPCDC